MQETDSFKSVTTVSGNFGMCFILLITSIGDVLHSKLLKGNFGMCFILLITSIGDVLHSKLLKGKRAEILVQRAFPDEFTWLTTIMWIYEIVLKHAYYKDQA
ncbi:hypothetical protein DY000_02018326 [Brassica cretica]|uniref:Uncharacterized protein n=1 Tax=Brassica cretica TaxID=69181 RepID=A0ABQ7CNG1_BRACR|nr:hypothetical protein DY000_02018326 [Brassica cretica]